MAYVIYTLIAKIQTVTTASVAKIPVAGFVIALITVIMLNREMKTKKKIMIVSLLHFISVSVVMVILGILFEWIKFETKQVLLMLICIVFVYAFTSIISYLTSKKEAEEITGVLINKFSDKE